MKRLIAPVLLFAAALSLQAQGKPIITVLDFNTSGISVQEMKVVIGYLSGALFKTGKYNVIDVTKRDALLKEMEFSASGCTDEACQLKIGKMLTAAMVVVGDISKLGSRYLLSARMLETETASTLNIADGKYSALDELVDDLDAFGKRLAGTAGNVAAVTSRSTATVESPKAPAGKVLVKGGTFRMGSESGDDDEKPVHEVRVADFYIGKYEVTQKEYTALMGTNPSYFKGNNLPVEQVNWYDAVAYCNKLSERDRLKTAYTINGTTVSCDWSANGWRLPTEAEWEYAARGGAQSQGYSYAGSNDVNSVAWSAVTTDVKGTQPVGTKAANELRLYDMSGNVWEWCWDLYGAYASESQTDPRGPTTDSGRVMRGGSWFHISADFHRSALRNFLDPARRFPFLGFRPVRTF